MASCEDANKIDGYRCVTLLNDSHEIYLRCRNSKTKESFNAGLGIIGRCLQNQKAECPWILTDQTEYEKFRKAYESQCKTK